MSDGHTQKKSNSRGQAYLRYMLDNMIDEVIKKSSHFDFPATMYVWSKMQDLSPRFRLIPRGKEGFSGYSSQALFEKNENSELDIYVKTNPMKGIISRKSETLLIYENRVIK